LNYYGIKTPEEKKAIAKKRTDTRQRNKLIKEAALREQMLRLDSVEMQIKDLEDHRDRLGREVVMGNLSAKLTGKTLLRECEILDGCQPWTKAVGVYFLIKDGRVVYVGQSGSVYSRISNHQSSKDFDSIAWVPCDTSILDRLESLYIHSLRPILNGTMNNGYKSAPMSLDKIFMEKDYDGSNSNE